MKKNRQYIAVYSRKSRFTGKGESIGNQVELCREYVRTMFGEEWLDRIRVFEDEGFSGGNLNRPAFREMLAAVRAGEFRAILVYRLDRISRNISDFTGLIEELTKREVAFVSIREQFDTSTPMGRAMMFIISVFSQLERETIAERIRDNMHELAKTGRWLGGNTPTGFASESVSTVTVDGRTRKSCRLTLIPEEAETVKLIFDLYTQTDSLTATEAELLRRRIPSKTGREHSRFSIRAILCNPVYMTADDEAYQYFAGQQVEVFSPPEAFDGCRGIMAYNRTDQEKGRSAIFLPMQQWIVAVGAHPGLIPARQWIAVQNSLERNRSKSYRKPRSNQALLTGLLCCACGDKMYPKLTQRRNAAGETVYTYLCHRKERSKKADCDRPNISGNALDASVIRQLKAMTGEQGAFTTRLEQSRRYYADSREQRQAQLEPLREEVARKEATLNGLIDTLAQLQEPSAKEPLLKRVGELSAETGNLRQRIRELEERTREEGLSSGELEQLRQKLLSFRETVDAMSVEEKRSAIRAVVQKVIWDGEKVHLLLTGGEGSVPRGEDSK